MITEPPRFDSVQRRKLFWTGSQNTFSREGVHVLFHPSPRRILLKNVDKPKLRPERRKNGSGRIRYKLSEFGHQMSDRSAGNRHSAKTCAIAWRRFDATVDSMKYNRQCERKNDLELIWLASELVPL
jgi:hypothetical protein